MIRDRSYIGKGIGVKGIAVEWNSAASSDARFTPARQVYSDALLSHSGWVSRIKALRPIVLAEMVVVASHF